MRFGLSVFCTCVLASSAAWAMSVFPTSIKPPGKTYDSNEVLWLEAAEDVFYVCRASGEVSCWNLAEGKRLWAATLKDFDPEANRVFLKRRQDDTLMGRIGRSSEGESKLDFCTLPDLRLLWEAAKVEGAGLQGYGFSKDGAFFFCGSFRIDKLYALDLKTKRIAHSIASPDARTGISFFDDGRRAAVFGFNALVFYDDKGKAVARIGNKKGTVLQPLPFSSAGGPDLPFLLAFADGEDEKAGKYLAFSSSGKTLWQRQGRWGDLLAITPDGKKLAFRQGDNVRIEQMEDDSKPAVEVKMADRCEASFSTDGKLLLLIPAIEEKARDEKTNKVPCVRKSQIVQIVDAASGKVVRSVDLAKSQGK